MGRQKRFQRRKQVSVIFESNEHDDLRMIAAAQRLSVSEYIRDLVMNVLWKNNRREETPPDLQSDDAEE